MSSCLMLGYWLELNQDRAESLFFYMWNVKKNYILKIRLINVVLLSLWPPKILTAVKYETACEAFLTENSKKLLILLGHKNEQRVGKRSCNGNA